MLYIEDLACGYGETALFRGLKVELRPGDIARVMGDNGTGKTTLLRTLAALRLPLAGSIRWRRADRSWTTDPTERGAAQCFIGHDNALNGALTPVENLEFLMRLASQPIAGPLSKHCAVAISAACFTALAAPCRPGNADAFP